VATAFYASNIGVASALSEQTCSAAIAVAARSTGVPIEVLTAVALTETGRQLGGKLTPWPWAINVRGEGEWVASEEDLLEAALEQIALGETSFDVGCFQLNYRWHAEAFSSLDEMISPTTNALYAAKFLKSLYSEFEDWTEAAGAYHSRTEVHATAYKAKFSRHLEQTQVPSDVATQGNNRTVNARQNTYPLLQTVTSISRLGSLVPSVLR